MTKSTINPETGNVDLLGLTQTEADYIYLKLDQTTTPQTILLGTNASLQISSFEWYGIDRPLLLPSSQSQKDLYIKNKLGILGADASNIPDLQFLSYDLNNAFDIKYYLGADNYLEFKDGPNSYIHFYKSGKIETQDGTRSVALCDGTNAITAIGKISTDNQLVSSLATGTKPLDVSSTTLCSNLNADLWDGYQFSDYLDQAVKTTSSPTFANLTDSGLTASKVVFTDGSKKLTSTGIGTSAQFIKGDGSLDSAAYVTSVTGTSPIASSGGTTPAISIDSTYLVPTGVRMAWGRGSAPSGWLLMDGSAVSRSTYANLFAQLNPSIGGCTLSIASPCVVTCAGHGLLPGDRIYFTTTGALPTGVSANTAYYIRSTSWSTDAFTFSTTAGTSGSAVNSSGSQSGTHTLWYSEGGVGDGSTTFNVPNWTGRTVFGFVGRTDTNFNYIGRAAGATTHTHTLAAGALVGTYTAAYSTATGNNSTFPVPYIVANYIIKY